jgi:putative spermidine/putrescine transport system ATP-binding protein
VRAGRAAFLGADAPTLDGSITSGDGVALVRPEHLGLEATTDDGHGTVVLSTFLGATGRTRVQLDSGETVVAQVPSDLVERLAPGTRVRVTPSRAPVLVVE